MEKLMKIYFQPIAVITVFLMASAAQKTTPTTENNRERLKIMSSRHPTTLITDTMCKVEKICLHLSNETNSGNQDNTTEKLHIIYTESNQSSTTILNESQKEVETGFSFFELMMLSKPEIVKIDKYVTIFIYCVGFPGNVLSFIVWIQKRMRQSSGCYLAALALDDFIFLSLHVVYELHSIWGYQPLNTPVICEIFPVVFLAAQYLDPLLVLGFTTERYISICHPFKREQYCTVRRAKMVIIALVASATCLSCVQGYFYTHNSSTSDCGPREQVLKGGSRSFLILWNLGIEIITFFFVPIAVLALNMLVIMEMRRLSMTEHVIIHGRNQSTSATTMTLLVVSFYLIITVLPVTIVYTLFLEFEVDASRYQGMNYTDILQDKLFKRWTNYQLVLITVKEFGVTHYAFNILFYMLTGEMFRTEIKKMFLAKTRCPSFASGKHNSIRGSLTRQKTKSNDIPLFSHCNHSLKGNANEDTATLADNTQVTVANHVSQCDQDFHHHPSRSPDDLNSLLIDNYEIQTVI